MPVTMLPILCSPCLVSVMGDMYGPESEHDREYMRQGPRQTKQAGTETYQDAITLKVIPEYSPVSTVV